MRAKHNALTKMVLLVALAICLILVAFQRSSDHDLLSSLQKMIVENGSCSIPVGGPRSSIVIQANLAKIENDTLILNRSTATGDNSWVVLSGDSASIEAKSVSIRFLKEPTDKLEITLHEAKIGGVTSISTGQACLIINRRWSLRQWFSHYRAKLKKYFV